MNVGLKISGLGQALGSASRRLESLLTRTADRRARMRALDAPHQPTSYGEEQRTRPPINVVGVGTTPAQTLFKDL